MYMYIENEVCNRVHVMVVYSLFWEWIGQLMV